MFNNTNKGQGALEYLIIIGAAILVAVIVVSLIISISRSNSETATRQNDQFSDMIDNTIIPPIILTVDCNMAGSNIGIAINPSTSPNIDGYCLVLNGVPDLTNCSNTNPLYFTKTMTTAKQNVSLIAKRGTTAYSQPSMPPIQCTPHN